MATQMDGGSERHRHQTGILAGKKKADKVRFGIGHQGDV